MSCELEMMKATKELVVLIACGVVIAGCAPTKEFVRADDGTLLEPYQHCWYEDNPNYSPEGETTNRITGAIVGGAVGNQFGKGDGKKAMTAVEVLLGAAVAHESGRIRKCETRYREAVIEQGSR